MEVSKADISTEVSSYDPEVSDRIPGEKHLELLTKALDHSPINQSSEFIFDGIKFDLGRMSILDKLTLWLCGALRMFIDAGTRALSFSIKE